MSSLRSARAATHSTSQDPARPADTCDVFETNPVRAAHVRARLMPEPTAASLAETFRVLGDPTRLRILDAIATDELCVCDIATAIGLSESAVSHQLRLLRGMRLVRSRRSGRMVFYALDDEHITTLFAQGLRHVQEAAPARGRTEPADDPLELSRLTTGKGR